MKRYRVSTPTPGYTGDSAEVHFKDGFATLDVADNDPQDKTARRLAYFREAGYGVQEIDSDGEPVEADEDAAEPLPSDTAKDWVWRMYAVQHAGMSVAEVDALGDRADVMKAVRDRRPDEADDAGGSAKAKSPSRKRAPRKASAVPGDDASDDELRQYVRTKAIDAGDDELAKKTETMSHDELVAHVKGQAK